MKALKIDDNGDWVMENGSFVMVEGDEQLAQEARISIETVKGEWFLDLDEGMDRTPFLGKNFEENAARSNLIESLVNTSEPLSVEKVTFAVEGRTLSVEPTLKKDNGEVLQFEGVKV